MIGYKCFNKGLINRYGKKFEIGRVYHSEGETKFGIDGNGFHMCERLEDTLRYYDAMNKDVDICIVNCYGNYDTKNDYYYDYFDMYAYEYMEIQRVLSRDEIIAYALNLQGFQAERFLSLYRLTPFEIELFKDHFRGNNSILNVIAYYQEKNVDVYEDNNPYVRKRKK